MNVQHYAVIIFFLSCMVILVGADHAEAESINRDNACPRVYMPADFDKKLLQHVTVGNTTKLCCPCNAGERVIGLCSSDNVRSTICERCPRGEYRPEYAHIHQKCLKVSLTECSEGLTYISSTTISPPRCDCPIGQHLTVDRKCETHTECVIGEGVKVEGMFNRDTQCEKCPPGYNSTSISSTEKCTLITNHPVVTSPAEPVSSCNQVDVHVYIVTIIGLLFLGTICSVLCYRFGSRKPTGHGNTSVPSDQHELAGRPRQETKFGTDGNNGHSRRPGDTQAAGDRSAEEQEALLARDETRSQRDPDQDDSRRKSESSQGSSCEISPTPRSIEKNDHTVVNMEEDTETDGMALKATSSQIQNNTSTNEDGLPANISTETAQTTLDHGKECPPSTSNSANVAPANEREKRRVAMKEIKNKLAKQMDRKKDVYDFYRYLSSDDHPEQYVNDLKQSPDGTSEIFHQAFAKLVRQGWKSFNPSRMYKYFVKETQLTYADVVKPYIQDADSE